MDRLSHLLKVTRSLKNLVEEGVLSEDEAFAELRTKIIRMEEESDGKAKKTKQ